MMVFTLVIFTLIGILGILILYLPSGKTPPFIDDQGIVLQDSIASLEKVRLGGVDQWVLIRGKNINNPILLYLSGGPGGSELGWVRHYNADLENHFNVVIWEQRGAGKSYRAADYRNLKAEQFVMDAYELVQHLLARFQQEKVYLIGHSWGTILGIWLIQRYPELFYAYVGIGQMVAPVENDRLGYLLAMKLAKEKQDIKGLAELEKIGPPPYGKGAALKYAKITTPGFSYMAEKVGSKDHERSNLSYLLNPQEYRLTDKINVLRGLRAGMDNIYPQLDQVDLIKQAVKLRVPVYFMSGIYDVNTFSTQVEKYYQAIIAPHKKLIWFGQSGHSPCFEEPERFNELMVKIVLAETYHQELQSQLLFER